MIENQNKVSDGTPLNPVLRKVERKNGDKWETTTFDTLRKGDFFKLYDLEGDVQYEDGTKVYVATSDAQPYDPPGNYIIEADNVMGEPV